MNNYKAVNRSRAEISVRRPDQQQLHQFFQIERINGYLSDICEKIGAITGNSEQQFLEIGGKLQSYLSRSKKLAENSASIASSITGAILQSGINEISWLLKQFSEKLSSSSETIKNDKNELLSILSYVIIVFEGLEGFRKIVKHLRMLGISTKIESARLGDEDKGFNTLAEHVEKLSNMINDKVALIASKSSFLQSEINSTTKELERLEKDQEKHSKQILSSTGTTLNQFEDKYNECSLKADKISKSSVNVSRNISDIVTSIQFHDITRQQMEHVNEALKEAAEKAGEINLAAPDSSLDNIEFIHDICELQGRQLSSSINEFVDAVNNIVGNLKGVESFVSEIYSDTAGLITQGDSKDGNLLGKVKEELLSILQGLNKNEEISTELASSIKDVIDIVEDLAKFVSEIEEIGTEIEIIALNARIKAAHTGLNGLALGVLAEEIQKLSIDAKQQTVGITKVLNDIGKISQKLRQNNELSAEENKTEDASVTNKKIIDLINSTLGLESETKNEIDKIRADVNNLKEDISVTVDEIIIHHENKQVSDGIIETLNFIIRSLQEKFEFSSDRSQNVAALMAKYTMDSERRIHESFAGLAKSEGEQEQSGSTIYTEDDLGDNVDLF